VHVYKASTPTGTWTEQDSAGANRPTTALEGDINRWYTTLLLANGVLLVAYKLDGSADYGIFRFNTVTDQWIGGGTNALDAVTSQSLGAGQIQLAQRGDGEVYAFYCDGISYHGDIVTTIKESHSSNNGSTWTVSAGIDDSTPTRLTYGDVVCTPGSQSADVHFMYSRSGSTANSPPTSHDTLQAATVSTSTRSTTGTTSLGTNEGNTRYKTNAVFIDPVGAVTGRVVAGGSNENGDLLYPRSDEDGNNDLSAPVEQLETATSPTIKIENEASHLSTCVDGDGVIHFVYADATDNDLYELTSSDDGDSLDSATATELLNGVTASFPSASVVGNNMLVVWDDGTNIVVDVFSLGDPNVSQLPAETLTLSDNNPTVVTSDKNTSQIDGETYFKVSRDLTEQNQPIWADSIPLVNTGDLAVATIMSDAGGVNCNAVTAGWSNTVDAPGDYGSLIAADKALTGDSGDYAAEDVGDPGLLARWMTYQYSLKSDGGVIAHVGSTSAYRDNTGGIDGTDLPITHGITIQAGDVIVATVYANRHSTNTNTISDNNGSFPFTEEWQRQNPGSVTGTLSHWTRVAGANEPATYNWVTDQNKIAYIISLRVYRNVDNTNPYSVLHKPLEIVGYPPDVVTTEFTPGETSLLPAETLDLADFDPQAVTTENQVSQLDAETLDLVDFDPQIVTTENNFSQLDAETLDLADFDPTVVASDNQRSLLDAETLDLTDFDPQAVTTENQISQLDAETLNVAANDPQAVTTENQIALLAAASLAIAAFAPQITTTDNNISELESETLTLTDHDPQATVAANNFAQLPGATLSISDNDPQAVTTEKNISTLPVATLTVSDFDPQAVTTEANISQLDAETLDLVDFDPQAVTTQGEVSLLPAETLSLTDFDPTVVATENHISLLDAETLDLIDFDPQAVTTESNISALDAETLDLVGFDPQAVTSEGEISLLPAETLSLADFDPQAVTTEKNITLLPAETLTVTGHSPDIGTTENNVAALDAETLTLTGYDPQAVTGDANTSQLPVDSLTVADFDPQAVTTEANIVELPSQALSVADFDPQAVTTENNFSQLDAETLTLVGYAPDAVTTEGQQNDSLLPAETLTLADNDPTIVTTERVQSLLPAANLVVADNDPTVVATENKISQLEAETLDLIGYAPTIISDVSPTNVSELDAETLDLVGYAPTIVTSTNNISLLDAETIDLSNKAPVVVSTERDTAQLPSQALSVANFAPQVEVTEIPAVALPSASLTLTGYAVTVATTTPEETNIVNLPETNLTLITYAPTIQVTRRLILIS
jgi:hypothetical protein